MLFRSADTSETYKVRVEYRTDINLNQIPATNQTLSLQFTVTYRQATSSATPVRNYVYRANFVSGYIGSNVSSLGTTYGTYQDLVNATGYNIFIRNRIENNQVIENAVGFVYNNNVYYLIGGGATYNSSTNKYNADSIYYEQNRVTLQSAFGSSNCSSGTNNGIPYYSCAGSNGYAVANANGTITILETGVWDCGIYIDGTNQSSVCGQE